jgi:hypothetical protein
MIATKPTREPDIGASSFRFCVPPQTVTDARRQLVVEGGSRRSYGHCRPAERLSGVERMAALYERQNRMAASSVPAGRGVSGHCAGHHQSVFNLVRRWRERSARARRLTSLNACPECGHNWGEHGLDNDLGRCAGECAHEIEHGLRPTGRPGCRLRPPDRADRAYYEEIAGQLRGLLIRLDDRLPGKDATLIAEFIDAYELGLALEQMADVLGEDEKPLSADERADVLGLVDRTRMDDRVPRALAFCPER